MAGISDDDATNEKGYVFSDEAMHEVLLELARNYKGKDPDLDKRIDAAASIIANDQRVTFIAPHEPGAPKVPLYLEGEPGQGKSSLVVSAVKKFCEICGLNFVMEPEESYVFKPNDFYYVLVNLSGAQNKSDFGGMMIRTEMEAQQFMKARRKSADVGSVVLDELLSRGNALAGFSKDMGKGAAVNLKSSQFEIGNLEAVELVLEAVDAPADDKKNAIPKAMAATLIRQISEVSKAKGVGIKSLKEGEEASDGNITYQLENASNGAVKLTMYAPRVLDAKAEFASAVLPSIRFAKFRQAKFGLVNFDDVANANENIRNVLLEVLQTGRYTGTMDIGNAYVTLSGNQGAEDGTNVMSRMSDAEITRIRKLSVRDRSEDWAARITTKYGASEVGDCLMASFIHRNGKQDGIFREPAGQRGKRGERKTNGRALENALTVIRQHFQAARAAGITPMEFRERIRRDIRDCAGKRVADAFDAHLVAMTTLAIPLADKLVNEGKFDVDIFEKNGNSGRDTSGQDFYFRFGAATADAVVNRLAFDPANRKKTGPELMKEVTVAMARACVGMAHLMANNSDTVMAYTLSSISRRLSNIPQFSVEDTNGRKLSGEVNIALGAGFATANATGVFGDEAESKKAEAAFCKVISGSNLAGMKSAKP